MTPRHFRAFAALTFGISWGVPSMVLLLTFWTEGAPPNLAMYSPLYYVGVWGPAIAAVAVIVHATGRPGLRAFFGRLLDWRFSARWLAFALVGIPALYFAGAVGHWLWGGADFSTAWNLSLPLFLGSTLARASAGPVEELGWRGFALPLLQRWLHPWAAVFVIAGVHSLWHAPVFLIGQFAHFGAELPLGWALLRFSAQILAISVIFSIAYNASGGSLTLAMLLHLMLNLAYPWKYGEDYFLGQTIALSIAAALLVAGGGVRWLRRDNASTVIAPGVG